MQYRDSSVSLVDRMDDAVDVTFASIKKMAEVSVLGRNRTSGRMLVEAENGCLQSVEPIACTL
jgi:hypothetical protein